MALYQGVELKISSGFAGTTMMTVERLQGVNFGFDFQRADVRQLNRFRPDINRPTMNYTPVTLSFDYIKGDSMVESVLGLTNPTGVICGITNSKALAGYGMRNFEIWQSPLESNNYVGQFNLSSGVLNSYSLAASVGDFAKTSLSFQNFDIGWVANSTAKGNAPTYNGIPVRSQDIQITGINFSGFGVSGFALQSFNLGINISRSETMQIGSKFPTERQIVDATATLQVQGFIEGGNSTLTGFGSYDCGAATNGSIYITLLPSCGATPAMTYRAINPYFQGMSQNNTVGNFASVDLSFIIPLPISAHETGSASNLIIS